MRPEFLHEILNQEAPPLFNICITCRSRPGEYRCDNCLARPMFCEHCLHKTHSHLPFHRIRKWINTHFKDAWLRDVGITLSTEPLAEHSEYCAAYITNESDGNGNDSDSADIQWNGFDSAGSDEDSNPAPASRPYGEGPTPLSGSLSDDASDDDDDAPEILDERGASHAKVEHVPHIFPPPPKVDKDFNPILTIVHVNGVHHMGIKWCTCPNAPLKHIQLLRMGLYPASIRNPKTAFTFHVLDDYLAHNRECKTTAMSYYSKVRRATTSIFPHLVPVSYPFVMISP